MRAIVGIACLLPPLLLCAAAAPDKLASLVAELAQARGSNQATRLEAEIESSRLESVTPTARLLLRRAQRQGAMGDPRAAVTDLDDALTLQPNNPLLWRQRAHARAAAGDVDGAVADLGIALARAPDDVLAWRLLSAIETDRASWTAAYEAWQHVLQLDPSSPGADKHLDKLRLKAFGQPA